METCRDCEKIRECLIRHALRNMVQDKLDGLIQGNAFLLVIERELPGYCGGFLDTSRPLMPKERPEATLKKPDISSPGRTGGKWNARHEAIKTIAAAAKDYLADHPNTTWCDLWRAVPNHYRSSVGFMQAMKKIGIQLNNEREKQ
jgi:hypothetical protein